MAKVKLQYKTGDMVNPATKQKYTDRRSVHIVNLRIYNIDELVKFALDNNYVEGAKYELAKGIAKGLIEAERALLLAGNAVSIDGWVKYEPSLKGSVAADKRQLTKDNSLAVTIRALKELKMPLDTFSWQLADEGFKPDGDDDEGGDTPEPAPEPATVVLRTAVTEGMMDNNIRSGSEPVTLVGENLTLGEGDTLWAKNYDNGDEDYVEIPLTFVKRNTSTAIDLGDDVNDPFWAWLGEQVEFTEEHDRITFKLVSHGGVPSSEPQVRTCTAVVQFA